MLNDNSTLPYTPTPTQSTNAGMPTRSKRILMLVLAATFVVFLNETIMGVAIPRLTQDLGVDLQTAQWLTTAFMLTMAIVIPTTGFLLQRFSTRTVFVAAMTLFSIGTLTAGIAPGFEVLLCGRVIQASGTAIMLPLLMTTLMTLVPVTDRGRYMGRVSIVMSVAPAIGPTISGIILDALSWRFMFLLMLPIALIMLTIGARKVENASQQLRAPLDVLSIVLSAIGFGGVVFGLSQVGESQHAESVTGAAMWIAFGGGAIAIVLFILRQLVLQKTDSALLDLRTFRSGNFSLSVGLLMLTMAMLFGMIIVLPVYLQQVLHLGALETGLFLLPGGLLCAFAAPPVGRLFDRFGPRPLLFPGSVLVSAVFWWFTTLSETTPIMVLLAANILLNLGLGLVFTPLFTAALGSVPPRLYSHGSAVVGTTQQLAGAAGTALFVTVMTAQVATVMNGQPGSVPLEVAQADGVRAAFLVGALLSVPMVVGAFFVRKPVDMSSG